MSKKILLRSLCVSFILCLLLSLPILLTGCTKSYNVIFNCNFEDGEVITVSVEEGSKASVQTPIREGYRFDDWYMEDYCKTKFDFSKKIEGDVTLYAGWIKQYKVEFYNNDGTTNKLSEVIIDEETPLVYPVTNPTREGYNFTGWYFDKDCNDYAGKSVKIIENVKLYAGWSEVPVPVVYTVNWDFNFDSEIKSYLKKYYSLEDAPISPIVSLDVEEGNIALFSNVTVDGCLIDEETGEFVKVDLTPELSGVQNRIIPGYRLEGWYYQQDTENNKYYPYYQVASDFTLYAKWVKVSRVDFLYHNDDAEQEVYETKFVDTGSRVTAPQTPTLDCCTFTYWSYDNKGYTRFNSLYTVNDDINVYANWEKIKVTLKFIVDGSEYSKKTVHKNHLFTDMMPRTPKKGDKLGFNVSKTEQYAFDDWYTDDTYTTKFDFTTMTLTQDTSVYAKWNITNYAFITFVPNGGKMVEQQHVKYGEKVTDPLMLNTDRVRENTKFTSYRFDGWFDNSAFTGTAYDFDTEVSGDITLYAKWTKMFTIKVEVNAPLDSGYKGNDIFVTVAENGTISMADLISATTSLDMGGKYEYVGFNVKDTNVQYVFNTEVNETNTPVDDFYLTINWKKTAE